MKPILFKSTETKFTTQGIGTLTDAISCEATEERNSTYEIELDYPVSGVHYDDIQLGNIIYVKPADYTEPQAFRIYQISKPINQVVTVNAEHISYQLSHIPVKPFKATGIVSALQGLKDNSIEENPFDVWTDDTNATTNYTQDEPASFRSRLGGVTGSILDCFGGEYEWDMWTVKHHLHRGTDRGVVIEYGKNLTDVKQEELISNVVTGIVPYWKSNTEDNDTVVMLPEYVIESDNADKYAYKRTIVYDFSSDFENQPTVEQLRNKCNSYMKSNLVGVPEISIDASFVNLADTEEFKDLAREQINLCDRVTIRFLKLGINATAKVTKIVYDCLAERITKISIGSSKSNFVKTVSELQKETEQQSNNFFSTLVNALAHQKTLMDGGLGGHIVTNYVNGYPSEIIIGDTDNIETMKKCLRINEKGIAFSINGYDGPYVTAWTIDGNFDASFIRSGEIDGNLIKAQTIIAGALDQDTQDAIQSGVEANETATANKESIEQLQNEVDGVIETWFYDYAPSDDKEPTKDWTTDAEKKKHAGDLFYDSSTGYSYRYTYLEGAYQWVRIADSDVTKALKEAENAMKVAEASINTVTVEYGLSSSTTTEPTSWRSDTPTWTSGKYIWQRTKTTLNDGTVNYSDAVCIQGAKGEQGAQGVQGEKGDTGATGSTGATGVGISKVTPQYYLSTSNTSQTGGSWSETQHTWSSGKYIWTRSKIDYTDGTTKYSTVVLASALNSANQTASNAQSTANTANSTANSANTLAKAKKRIYYTTPTVPYDLGDLWVQGHSGQQADVATVDESDETTYVGDIMYCSTAKTSAQYFEASDWSLASNYTDNQLAIIAQQSASEAQDSANKAQTSADNAQASADSATVKANEASQKADSNKDAINSLNSSVSDLSNDVNSLESSVNEQAKKAQEAQTNINNIKNDITRIEAKADTASTLAQRITVSANGLKINSTSDGKSYVLLQNDGMRVYVGNTLVAEYLADRANVNNMYFNEGKLGNHIVDIFTMNSVEGTAFFYAK